MGQKDKAFEWLARAYEEHSGNFPTIFEDFSFESLHSDPRVAAIIGFKTQNLAGNHA
jgi:hypothetical protein